MGCNQQYETIDRIVWCQTARPARECPRATSSGGGGGAAGQGLDCSPGREERGPGKMGAAPCLALGAARCRILGIHTVFGVCPKRPTERRCYHLPMVLAHSSVCSLCDICFPKNRSHGRKPSIGVASTNQIRRSCGTSIKSEVRKYIVNMKDAPHQRRIVLQDPTTKL